MIKFWPWGWILAASAVLLTSCASTCPVVVPAKNVEIQKVDVPVEVARVPPDELLGCWNDLPAPPHFEQGPQGTEYLVLQPSEIEKYKALIPAVKACDDKWRVWATAAPEKQ